MERNTTKILKNSHNEFYCERCDYTCSRKGDFKKHINSKKHNTTNTTKIQPKILHSCECGKKYTHRASLYNHKRGCTYLEIEGNCDGKSVIASSEEVDYKGLLFKALDEMQIQRQELMDEIKKKDDMMMEIVGKIGTNTTNNTQNNQFNINMFLNETCKDAINFSDFIDRIEISHDDLENNAQLGFVNGMTKILMDNLKLLTVQERPIHCTDVKRETLYIKDENKWNKDHSVEILENAIKEVSRKSMQSLSQWKKSNPDYKDMDSEFSKKCIPMQQNSMGLCNKESFYPKIIHNLAKENTISHLK